MNDKVENLILTQLREMRGEMGEMRADIAEIKSDLGDVNQKVDGLTMIMTMLAGHVAHIEERVESLEGGDKSA